MSEEILQDRVTHTADEVLAYIVKDDAGYHVQDLEGNVGDVCKIVDDGKTIALTKNESNRQYFNLAKADAAIEADGKVALTFKATVKVGSTGTRLPNAKLISYLPQELQDEYKAIVDRAIAAKEAAKKKPMTAEEKLRAKIAKYEAELAELGVDQPVDAE